MMSSYLPSMSSLETFAKVSKPCCYAFTVLMNLLLYCYSQGTLATAALGLFLPLSWDIT
jgi:hypothetical protein